MMSLSWWSLCGTVFVLGIRHGLDADHLAAIDGLTRYNCEARPRLARWCGALFSVGHGSVVMVVATVMGSAASAYEVPRWLEGFGSWVSILFLLLLGSMNLRCALITPADEMVKLDGMRSALFAGLTQTYSPFAVIAMGVLFAFSFDTLSQAVLFSTTGVQFGGASHSAVLGCLFTLGMISVDGANGAWVAGLLRRQDRRARLASRAMAFFVAGLSFVIAGVYAVRYFDQGVEVALGRFEATLGVMIVVMVAAGIVLGGRLCAQPDSMRDGR